jgi:hypothetical protein
MSSVVLWQDPETGISAAWDKHAGYIVRDANKTRAHHITRQAAIAAAKRIARAARTCAITASGDHLMAHKDDLTEFARSGYYGNANPHLATSPAHWAHALGAYLHATGRSVPRDVRMGRGDSIRANDMRFKVSGAMQAPDFERIE